MIKKLLLVLATMIAMTGFAFAQVELNKADKATLDGVKGIGPKMSKTIVDERKKNGEFKDWADFEKRVKGVGDKSSDNLSKAGLTINGEAKVGAKPRAAKAATAAAPAASAPAKAAAPAAAPATPATPAAPAAPATSATPAAPVKK